MIYRIKGKKKLKAQYGWYEDFIDNITDFKGKNIHWTDSREVRRDFKKFPRALFKKVVLPKEHELVQSLLSVFKSKSFLEENDKATGEKVEYDENGEPILDDEDWADATTWFIVSENNTNEPIYIFNKTANIAYAHSKFIKPLIQEELEERIFNER